MDELQTASRQLGIATRCSTSPLQHVAVAARHAVAGTGVPQRNVIGGERMNCMSDASAARGHRA
ncbi:hypothetical protein, partial [Xanthomonas oryzae]|uniref:hypothetical protein n=1 Tax=Xanthomonas oryzae TaxID=347 RepID=UPI001C4A0D10